MPSQIPWIFFSKKKSQQMEAYGRLWSFPQVKTYNKKVGFTSAELPRDQSAAPCRSQRNPSFLAVQNFLGELALDIDTRHHAPQSSFQDTTLSSCYDRHSPVPPEPSAPTSEPPPSALCCARHSGKLPSFLSPAQSSRALHDGTAQRPSRARRLRRTPPSPRRPRANRQKRPLRRLSRSNWRPRTQNFETGRFVPLPSPARSLSLPSTTYLNRSPFSRTISTY